MAGSFSFSFLLNFFLPSQLLTFFLLSTDIDTPTYRPTSTPTPPYRPTSTLCGVCRSCFISDTFDRIFGCDPITQVLRDDGEAAGDLYPIPKASDSSVLVTGSMWRINAPDTPYDKTDRSSFYEVGVKERVEKTANLFALQSVLMEAGVPGLDREVVECTQKQCTAFLMQVEGPSGDIEQNKAVGSVNDAIHNNTFDGYHTGSELQAGVASVANILAGAGSRMDPSLVPALILLLGARDFANVMEMLGYPINGHDFGASMEQFRKEQGRWFLSRQRI